MNNQNVLVVLSGPSGVGKGTLAKLIVEKEKPYYYIGIATSKKVIAFLLDGYTGEVLSIKEVF